MLSHEKIRKALHKKMDSQTPYSLEEIYEMVFREYGIKSLKYGDLEKPKHTIRGFLSSEKRKGRMDNPVYGMWEIVP